MNKTHRSDDELLSAHIDGELPADDTVALVERLANEPALVQRLESMRAGDDEVRAVFGQLDRAPMPDAVTQLLDLQESDPETSNVVSMRSRGVRRFASMPVALAASVALVAGILAVRQIQVEPPLNAVDALIAGHIDTGSDIHELLENGLSGQPAVLGDSAEMRVVLSFEGDGGNYCRQLYVVAPKRSVHGVACRAAPGWQVEAVAVSEAGTPDGHFQAAGGDVPEAVATAVDRLIGAREPLSADDESVLISMGWKKHSN